MGEIYDFAICVACGAEGPYNGEPVCPYCGGGLRDFDAQQESLPEGARRWRSSGEAEAIARRNGHPTLRGADAKPDAGEIGAIQDAVTLALMSVEPSAESILREYGARLGFDLTIHPQTDEDRRLGRVRVTAARQPVKLVTFTITVESDGGSRG